MIRINGRNYKPFVLLKVYMYKILKIISRKSDLAKIQASLVGSAINQYYKNTKIEFHTIESKADLDQTIDLSSPGQIGLFTKDISKTIIKGNYDIAVHSWKDIPVIPTKKTIIAGTLKRGDMRDLLIFKKSFLHSDNNNIELLTSSPRRKHNLTEILPDIIPRQIKNILFKGVRGNIETRLKKFIKGHSDGIILAKVAIDRLLEFGNQGTAEFIKEILNDNKWVILPLSIFPTAAGQGAIGIEIKNNRKNLLNFLNKINNLEHYNNVLDEKKILSRYGGGCQQKIGVSIWSRHKKEIVSLKGLTEKGKILSKFSSEEKNNFDNSKNIKKDKLYPILDFDKKIFKREFVDNSEKIESLKNSLIYLSRKNVLENSGKVHDSNIIWTSGLTCWKSAIKKGTWVNGTSDNLGAEGKLNLENFLPRKINFFKLSNSKALSKKYQLIPTYHLRLKSNVFKSIDISNKTHFFWMSPIQFDEFFKEHPEIIDRNHSCGFGNTFNHINKILPKGNKIKPYLSYSHWLESNLKENNK